MGVGSGGAVVEGQGIGLHYAVVFREGDGRRGLVFMFSLWSEGKPPSKLFHVQQLYARRPHC